MDRREAIIDMLARHRSMGDEAEYKRIAKEIRRLSTGLLMHLLSEEQLAQLREMERGAQ